MTFDKRFETVRHLNLPYDLSYIEDRYTRAEQWIERAAELREQVLGSAGLLPMPEKCPLKAQISGKIERRGYTVEKAYFESLPGFYVTGNLYRPACRGPFPAVLNPHGHWKHGRLENDDTCSVPGRCINFALQGYVAFSYDMVGYNDSLQVAHKFGGRMERLWGLSLGGLQLWNSIRAVDFVQSLADVDGSRIACTGASGGGTQTFLLCAVDDRVTVSAPVNMISAHMQGGCMCENLPGLRIDTDNVEIAALMAPRPMLMVSATGDWTKDTPSIEFPAVHRIYRLLGAEDKVSWVQIDAGHNYNKDSREAVYSWFARWLPGKSHSQPVSEVPFEVEKDEDLRVFPNGELPAGSLDADGFARQWTESCITQFKIDSTKLYSGDHGALNRFTDVYRPALGRALALPASFEIVAEQLSQETDIDIATWSVLIGELRRGSQIPAVVVEATDSIATKAVVVADGPSGSFMENGAVRKLAEQGWRVIGIECFGLGAHAAPEDAPERDPDKDFFDTYNRTDVQERVYDIVVAAQWASQEADRVALVGSGMAGLWCLLAAAFAGGVTDVVVDTCGLDISDDDVLLRDVYAPCLRRAGDIRTAGILCPPRRLLIHNTPEIAERADVVTSAYRAAGCESRLTINQSLLQPQSVAEWFQGE